MALGRSKESSVIWFHKTFEGNADTDVFETLKSHKITWTFSEIVIYESDETMDSQMEKSFQEKVCKAEEFRKNDSSHNVRPFRLFWKVCLFGAV